MIAPDVRDERLMELRSRGVDARPRIDWKSSGTFVSLLFFVLTSVAVGAGYGFLELIDLPGAGIFVGVAAIFLAELLIVRLRFFGTGVESALWLAGVFAFILGLPGEGRSEALLLFAAGSAVAGLRVRNALFGALAAVLVIAYAVVEGAHFAAASLGAGISLIALLALGKEWQRPSTEKLWIAMLVIPPIAATLATMERMPLWWVLVHLALAFACAVAGIRLRAHAPLIGAGVHGAIAVSLLEVHDLLPFAPQWQLIAGGALLLAASALAARALRGRTTGLVATPDSMTRFDEEMQIVATLAAQPRVAPMEGEKEGGRFGGGGATGDY